MGCVAINYNRMFAMLLNLLQKKMSLLFLSFYEILEKDFCFLSQFGGFGVPVYSCKYLIFK